MTKIHPPDPEPDSGATLFRAMLVYESLPWGKRAKGFCDMVTGVLGEIVEVDFALCRFAMLSHRDIRNAMASRAAKCDLVVICGAGSRPLPKAVKEWVRMWAWLIDGLAPALAMVCGKMTRTSVEDAVYLRGLAEASDIDFFSYALPETQAAINLSALGKRETENAGAAQRNSAIGDWAAAGSS